MTLYEAAFFYSSYADLFEELEEIELSEYVAAINTPEEILTCKDSWNAL